MPVWLPLSVFALAVWAVQRLLSKVTLQDLGTRKFYLLSAVVSLLTYAPYLLFWPPSRTELLPAFGLPCLMAVTFGVTTEAIRRGPLGAVSPITALSPGLTAALAILLLHERLTTAAYAGAVLAPAGVGLHSLGRPKGEGLPGWQALAIVSLVFQRVGAFISKLVVSPAGPSALLLMSAAVQVLVGLVLAPPPRWRRDDPKITSRQESVGFLADDRARLSGSDAGSLIALQDAPGLLELVRADFPRGQAAPERFDRAIAGRPLLQKSADGPDD